MEAEIPHPGHFDGLFRDSVRFSLCFRLRKSCTPSMTTKGSKPTSPSLTASILGLGCANDKAVAWKVLEQAAVKLNVKHGIVDFPVG